MVPFAAGGGAFDRAAERAEEDIGHRAVHRLAHEDGEDESRAAVERAGDDQHVVGNGEAGRRGLARPA